jgi:D-lactate dehydrogenase
MKVAFFSTKSYDRKSFEEANSQYGHELTFFEPRLTAETATLAAGFPAICVFINDEVDESVLRRLASNDTKLIALRCAGYNNVDLNVAAELGITVVHVPAYSPYAVAEFTAGLILMLNRKLYKAYNRVREDNFSLQGLLGFDLYGSTVGVVGTGKIGQCFIQIAKGFGCNILAYDVRENPACIEMGAKYVELSELLASSDIISLFCPLLPQTYHLINDDTIAQMKRGAMLINTSRGGLVDTKAVIRGIKSGQIGYFGADVYEEEAGMFYEDLSDTVIQDDTFQLLQSFPNVVITSHQAFFTRNALDAIAQTTLSNISDVEQGRPCRHEVQASPTSA